MPKYSNPGGARKRPRPVEEKPVQPRRHPSRSTKCNLQCVIATVVLIACFLFMVAFRPVPPRTSTLKPKTDASGAASNVQPPLDAERPPLVPRVKLKSSDPFYVKAPVPSLMPVYLTPLLSQEECEWIIGLAEAVNDWRPRLNYNTNEVGVLEQLPQLVAWMQVPGGVQERVFDLFRKQFKLKKTDRLSVDSSNIIRYDESNKDTNHVIMHADGSSFTFNVALSDPKSFEGGGTGMLHLDKTIWPERGEVLTYYGNLYHSGEPVTSGRRYIWQAFCRLNGGIGDESIADVPLKETTMQVAFAEKALALHPGLGSAWFSAGNLMRKLGRFDESAPFLERALSAGFEDKLLAYGKLYEAHSHAGNLVATRKYMQKVLAMDPQDTFTQEALERLENHIASRAAEPA